MVAAVWFDDLTHITVPHTPTPTEHVNGQVGG